MNSVAAEDDGPLPKTAGLAAAVRALALVLGHGVISVYAAFVSTADTMVSYVSRLMLPIAECR